MQHRNAGFHFLKSIQLRISSPAASTKSNAYRKLKRSIWQLDAGLATHLSPFSRSRISTHICHSVGIAIFLSVQYFCQNALASTDSFEQRDVNADGALSRSEYASGIGGKLRERYDIEFDMRDLNADELLSESEFQAPAQLSGDYEESMRRSSFYPRDRNEDGLLSIGEYTGGSRNAELIAAKQRFEVFDSDGDGFLTKSEFDNRGNLGVHWAKKITVMALVLGDIIVLFYYYRNRSA